MILEIQLTVRLETWNYGSSKLRGYCDVSYWYFFYCAPRGGRSGYAGGARGSTGAPATRRARRYAVALRRYDATNAPRVFVSSVLQPRILDCEYNLF